MPKAGVCSMVEYLYVFDLGSRIVSNLRAYWFPFFPKAIDPKK
jgi:hypothetical protein